MGAYESIKMKIQVYDHETWTLCCAAKENDAERYMIAEAEFDISVLLTIENNEFCDEIDLLDKNDIQVGTIKLRCKFYEDTAKLI